MTTSIYQLHNVEKRYSERTVLTIDSLRIEPGEIVALVGPSGAGKSTLLRLLNFLETPSSGRFVAFGQALEAGQPVPLAISRQVTTVFQRPLLLQRSVRANVEYGLQVRGGRAKPGMVEALLEEVGLTGLAEQPAHTLSGGEMQRVALARAAIITPAVLLLDEPTANLDPYNVGLIEAIVQRLHRQHNTTVIVVTHNLFQAQRLSQRTACLLEGKLVEVSPTEQFFNTPSDPRSEAFVKGRMVY